MKKICLPVVLAALVLCGRLFAQENPDYEVSVTTITVWVKVVDSSGNPVEGLAASDFEVYEDKQKVETNCFEEIRQPEGTETGGAAQGANKEDFKQKFVIYLDLLNTSSIEMKSLKPQLKAFLATIAPRKPEVMLTALLPTQRLGIVAPFTTDLKRIAALIDKAPANSTRDTEEISRVNEMRKTFEGAAELIDAVRDGYKVADSFANQDQQRSEFTLAALESFASHLSTLNFGDHVVVLYISGGFSSDPGRQYFDMVDDLISGDVSSSEDMQALSMHRRPNFDFNKELQKSIGKLNRYNVTISTLDTQGMDSSAEYRDSLVEMAQETGGISFSNSRNFGEGFSRILNDLKQQYVVCYSPPPHKKPGEYHTIKVTCKRPGVTIRHRDGYVE